MGKELEGYRMKTLVIYSSKYGATEKCATMLKDKLGVDCTLANIALESHPNTDAYETVMIGSSIYAGKMKSDIISFVKNNEVKLKEKNIGLFLCCKDQGSEALSYIGQNMPTWVIEKAFIQSAFGHEINLEKMNFVERNILKMIFKVKESYSKIDENQIDEVVEAIKKL